jgi:hypothetical protein
MTIFVKFVNWYKVSDGGSQTGWFHKIFFSFYERKVSYKPISVTQINGMILLSEIIGIERKTYETDNRERWLNR